MKAVRLSIFVPGDRYFEHQSWWVNFCQTEFKFVSDDHPLTKWGGKMRPGSLIEFEREEDATMFLLRWS